MNIFHIPAFTDNYIWALQVDNSITVVDPGDAAPVLKILEEKNLEIDADLINHLKEINNSLWEIEDKIRMKEKKQKFDGEFIELARSVYKENDIRASIKKEINQKYNSNLTEEKSYQR